MGKPLYQKTVYIESLSNSASGFYSHGAEDVENIFVYGMNAIYWKDEDYVGPLPYLDSANIKNAVRVMANKTNIRISTGVDRRQQSAYITIRYTKTTD